MEKVKPKKKFGFKNRKQKTKVPDISTLTVSGSEDQADNVQKYSLDNKNHYDIKDRSDENIVLDRNQVQGKDVTVTGLLNQVIYHSKDRNYFVRTYWVQAGNSWGSSHLASDQYLEVHHPVRPRVQLSDGGHVQRLELGHLVSAAEDSLHH